MLQLLAPGLKLDEGLHQLNELSFDLAVLFAELFILLTEARVFGLEVFDTCLEMVASLHGSLFEILRCCTSLLEKKFQGIHTPFIQYVQAPSTPGGLVERLLLDPPEQTTWEHSFSTMLVREQPDGTELRVSPIRDGSGLEQNLETNKRYIFILEPDGQRLVRVENFDKMDKIRELLQDF